MKTEEWYFNKTYRYLIAFNILLTLFLIANKPIIDVIIKIIGSIDQNWLSHPFTYLEGGMESFHSPFYIFSSVITFIAVVIGAWAYSRQARALYIQSDISNQTLIARSFENANSKLNTSKNAVEWSASISAIGDICVVDKKYIRRTKAVFDEFSSAMGAISPTGSIPNLTKPERILKNQISTANRAIISVMYRINKDANKVKFDTINEDYMAFAFSHLYIGRKILPHNNNRVEKKKIVGLNFENFSFYMCDLRGIHFFNCNLFNTRFYKSKNTEFTGCLFGIGDSDMFKSVEMNTCKFNDCYIWEDDIQKYDISDETIEKDFTVLDEDWFKEWSIKNGQGRVCDWSRYAKKKH